MRGRRLLITGASGAGTTTLGRALATRWAIPHADVDDYFWLPTSPPFLHKRPAVQRVALMEALFVPRDAWILSGSLDGWGDAVIARVDGVVFLMLDPGARMDRLMSREILRYGDTIEQGGTNEAAHRDFLEWARGYDDPATSGRSRATDDRWLASLPCPVLRLDSRQPVANLVAAVEQWADRGVTAGSHVR
ncbi:Adenylate kinase [Micromonospora pallida]|uniref:Adenylate kinase n=1 Tax=Micromonospora pallida TaxID=145854 RepID=A0A1C6RUA6_9ACTN|nr:hypothetical protein [Micromonospora pallida]SCL20801.1 Adenylate kinase [Micromonospora pallida]